MPHRYTSFLIRHWQRMEGDLRITVEHIQTGATITVASLEAATSWLGEQTAPGDALDPPLSNTALAAEQTGGVMPGPAP